METIKSISDYSFNIVKYLSTLSYNILINKLSTENKKKLNEKFIKSIDLIIIKFNEIINIINDLQNYENKLLDENNMYDSYLIHIPKTKTNEKYKEFKKIKEKIINNEKYIINEDTTLISKENYEDIIRYGIICFSEEINNKINIHICSIDNNELNRINYQYNLLSKEFLDKIQIKNYPKIPKLFNTKLFFLL